MALASFSWEEVCRRRLAAQHLRAPLPVASFDRMVADICGLHAQVMSAAELAAAVRLDGLRRGTVATALWEDRRLVKVWAQRGTLHLLLAGELPLYVAALSNRRFDLDGPWLKYFGLEAREVPALIDAVAEALDGRQLSREELASEVVHILGDPKFETLLASGWGALLKPAAFQGVLCFGPSEGNRVTFVRPDQWIGPFEMPDPMESLREMARRFLVAYGPATVDEFARWWGVKPKAVRPVFTVGDGFEQVEVEGRKAWTVEGPPVPDGDDGPVVRLLPLFDPYVVAVRRAGERPLDSPLKDLVYRKAGWISPVLLVDGELAGVWEHTEGKDGLRVDIRPFHPLDAVVTDRAVADARRLAHHLGAALSVTFSDDRGGFEAAPSRNNLS
ncbi:MAG TPA: winged helix DNA-binding domain-containing protein [Acidimicrobiales bacterium]|nr:winged helix DNA-binding domain-containing protein [Acidimicrobiales bacterium]